MKPENKAYLDRLRHHYRTLTQAGFIGHLQYEERAELLRIAREEWEPNYLCCITGCPEEIIKLVEFVYTQEAKEASQVTAHDVLVSEGMVVDKTSAEANRNELQHPNPSAKGNRRKRN